MLTFEIVASSFLMWQRHNGFLQIPDSLASWALLSSSQMSCGDVLYQLVLLRDIWMIMVLWKMEDPVGTVRYLQKPIWCAT